MNLPECMVGVWDYVLSELHVIRSTFMILFGFSHILVKIVHYLTHRSRMNGNGAPSLNERPQVDKTFGLNACDDYILASFFE